MTINLISNQHSVHHTQVEWDVLSGIISQFAFFESNKKKLVSDLYIERKEELESEFLKIRHYLNEFNDDYRQVISQIYGRLPEDETLSRFILHLSKDGTLNFQELNKIALLLEGAMFIKKDLPEFRIPEFETIQKVDFQPVQRSFLREFRYLVDPSGDVHLEKHPELSRLSNSLKELEDRIRRTIQDWINNPSNQKSLQFNSYDVHYDRYVVPVRSDSYRSDIGLIVSRSESGNTLFVEPFEVRDACNRRLELIAKIDEIINQLTIKFSRQLSQFSDLALQCLKTIEQIDFYLAKTAFAEKYQLEMPLLRDSPGFKFSNLAHPLISKAVKNDVECLSRTQGIVISGPNTGGKTVFLKSITLAYLLFYHGHFVPASEAEMFPYEGLFYFGNDLQDLKTGLSSFSGEVKNYINLMENILPSNLILIDEIFNSTSSDEASALSMAYFDELHKKATCHIVVSTHHQMFKTLIHQDQKYLSCHVGFDTENMKPTYKIQWGTPGASMAIDIFSILSRENTEVKNIPEKAMAHLSTKNISYETLLQRVSQKQIELDKILTSNRQLEVDLKNQKGAMEGVLNLKLNEELKKAKAEVDKILNEARSIVEEAKRNEIIKIRKIDDKAHFLKNQINSLRGETPSEKEEEIESDLDITTLKSGDVVHSLMMKKDFSVHSVDLRKNEVTIVKGAIKINVPARTLIRTKNALPKPKVVSVSYVPPTNTTIEIDARGMRLSEFQTTVDKALGTLLSGDIPYLNVIHGHGDGVLKRWLRDLIRTSKNFQSAPQESGNDGETKIILK